MTMYRVDFPRNMAMAVIHALACINPNTTPMASPKKGMNMKKAIQAPLPLTKRSALSNFSLFTPVTTAQTLLNLQLLKKDLHPTLLVLLPATTTPTACNV